MGLSDACCTMLQAMKLKQQAERCETLGITKALFHMNGDLNVALHIYIFPISKICLEFESMAILILDLLHHV